MRQYLVITHLESTYGQRRKGMSREPYWYQFLYLLKFERFRNLTHVWKQANYKRLDLCWNIKENVSHSHQWWSTSLFPEIKCRLWSRNMALNSLETLMQIVKKKKWTWNNRGGVGGIRRKWSGNWSQSSQWEDLINIWRIAPLPDCIISSQAIPLYLSLLFPLLIWPPTDPSDHTVNGEGRVEDQGGEHKISQIELWEKE